MLWCCAMRVNLIATYRIQLRAGMGFRQVEKMLGYLKELGISHLYASPYLQAMPQSSHGYDIVDPTSVDIELGGAKAHAKMCQRLQELNLGQLIDIVPNHMAISQGENPWWWDVLENGSSSRYAAFFDVDWDVSDERWSNKVLLPVLGDQYGRVLENGQLQLSRSEGFFVLHYEKQLFPIDPSSIGDLLKKASITSNSDSLAFLAASFDRLPKPIPFSQQLVEERDRDKHVLQTMLARLCKQERELARSIDDEVSKLNSDPDLLDMLIDRQNYRLSFWKKANRDLGYRRFFDVKDLVGLRVEDPKVFSKLHALSIDWIKKGLVQGLRVDHPDGLLLPTEYFHTLRKVCPDSWIVAEKVLEPTEVLPNNWPIDGTTGYDFLNLVGALFIDPQGKDPLTAFYKEITEEEINYEKVILDSKRLILTQILESELDRLTTLLVHICERHRRYRDYTRRDLREALCEVSVSFPVYRSYVSVQEESVRKEDEQAINQAIDQAMQTRSDLEPELFLFIKDILLLKVRGDLETELTLRFQQLSDSCMAKGVEDTAFYRFNRLIALNEVGSNPDSFGISLEKFYERCNYAKQHWPKSLLATTTHDTKRSDDVRARLYLLSEIPDVWKTAASRWFSNNKKYHTGDFPDKNTEYFFYQTLVGAWPIDKKRVLAYMEKAVREAKTYTSWTTQNEKYEQALFQFIESVLSDKVFIKDLERFVKNLILPGRINSLTQTLIKHTSPGVGDVYQGSEVWDLTLVDPDNRRRVNFSKLEQLLHEVKNSTPEQILERMDEGLPKLWVIYHSLAVRSQKLDSFGPQGAFLPIVAQGKKRDHAVAYMRGENVIVIAPRHVLGLGGDWTDTHISLPDGVWSNVLAQEEQVGGTLHLQECLKRFPVALLVKKE